MSSRRLIELIENLPATSSFKRARDGWPDETQIAAKTHEEIALYRASKYVGSDDEYMPQVFIPPQERAAALAAAQARAREDFELAMDLESLLSKALIV